MYSKIISLSIEILISVSDALSFDVTFYTGVKGKSGKQNTQSNVSTFTSFNK